MEKVIRWYKQLALIVMNALLLILLLNFLLFVYYILADTPEDQPVALVPGPLELYSEDVLKQAYPDWNQDDLTLLLTEHWSRPFICDQYVHFRERPFEGTYVNVSEIGFRHDGQQDVWPPDEESYTIFVFGGSTTFGYGITDVEALPAILEAELGRLLPDDSIAVYNFAQGGYFSSQELKLFVNLLYAGYRPDMVVFIDGHNDSWFNAYFGGGGPYTGPHLLCDESENAAPSSGFEIPMLRFANEVREMMQGQTQTAEIRLTPYEERTNETYRLLYEEPRKYQQLLVSEAQRVIEVWKTNRTIIQGIANQYSIDVVFVWQPSTYYKYDVHIFPIALALQDVIEQTYMTFEAMRPEWEQWDDFLYLADIQDGRHDLLYVDEAHYNAAFSAEIANHIAAFIMTKYQQTTHGS